MLTTWQLRSSVAVLDHADHGWSAEIDPKRLALSVRGANGNVLVSLASGAAWPSAPFAARSAGVWHALGTPSRVAVGNDQVRLAWTSPDASLVIDGEAAMGVRLALSAPGADATAVAWRVLDDEHVYGLGERFNKLDQRGDLIDLWVRNGASGGNTYKPVPFIASSAGYGVSVDTTVRVYAALSHPSVPGIATLTVASDACAVWLIPGANPVDVLRRYTAWVGRPPIPPAWVFRPWKSRDWRVEDQGTVAEDLAQHRAHGIPCGVKLIDATWETESHTFTFDPAKYPDVPGMMAALREADVELVVWLSPSMSAGTPEYEECARRGFLITNATGRPYLHRLGNQPGWEGTTIDFSNPDAVAWWQEKIRALMRLGIRGIKTDFGEQVPEDAHFANGKTGAEMHNLLPVLYNRATWEVTREYNGIVLARSAWAGSQRYPCVWAGDQSADFSPWGGLPTAIVAGQSAGWSGFPYWGSDVGGYFNPPDDEAFARWAQFSSVSPIMEAHGLGRREPWEFSAQTRDIYRAAATLHDQLVPYSLAASLEASETGLPLMRAMALLYPEHPAAHLDWVQYQFCYGPHLLAAPVYSWGASRQVWFPPGTWIDWETGERSIGPAIERVPAPIEKLPLYARAGAVIPLQARDGGEEEFALRAFPGAGAAATRLALADGTRLDFAPDDTGGGTLRVAGPVRPYRLSVPFQRLGTIRSDDAELHVADNGVAWHGPATIIMESSV